jgi:hypothetical protein
MAKFLPANLVSEPAVIVITLVALGYGRGHKETGTKYFFLRMEV